MALNNFTKQFALYKDYKNRQPYKAERVFFAWNKLTKEFETCFFSVDFSKVFLPNLECITSKKIL